jgi:hypothetical protein
MHNGFSDPRIAFIIACGFFLLARASLEFLPENSPYLPHGFCKKACFKTGFLGSMIFNEKQATQITCC